MLSYLRAVSSGHRVKPGLMFLLELAWESRARLPLLIMFGFMALGVRVQLEINIDRAARLVPRLRLEEEEEDEEEEEEEEDDEEDLGSEEDFAGWSTDLDEDLEEYLNSEVETTDKESQFPTDGSKGGRQS